MSTGPGLADDWPSDRPIEIVFDRYLDPDSVGFGAVRLTSGEVTTSVWVEYDPVGPAIRVHPFVELRPGVGYTLTVEGDSLRALDGGVASAAVFGFVAGPPSGMPDPPTLSDAEMEQLFAERCGCHGPDGASPRLAPLDRADLVGVPAARQPERTLLVPGRPSSSYLVQRILVDFPGVRGAPKMLSDDERRAVVRWVQRL